MYIFALLPHSRTNKSEQIMPWHVVIFDRWFNTHRLFNWKWETSVTYEPTTRQLNIQARWLKKRKWRLPWKKE